MELACGAYMARTCPMPGLFSSPLGRAGFAYELCYMKFVRIACQCYVLQSATNTRHERINHKRTS